jgi:hypothetical protein
VKKRSESVSPTFQLRLGHLKHSAKHCRLRNGIGRKTQKKSDQSEACAVHDLGIPPKASPPSQSEARRAAGPTVAARPAARESLRAVPCREIGRG